jgi:hypothetical protein
MNEAWIVEYTDEFEKWWSDLTEHEQVSVDASVRLLEAYGPALPFPYSSGVKQSRHGRMRELRIRHRRRQLRVLYAFDPRRAAILLVGGDKTGNDRWYDEMVPRADNVLDRHLEAMKEEEPRDGEEVP